MTHRLSEQLKMTNQLIKIATFLNGALNALGPSAIANSRKNQGIQDASISYQLLALTHILLYLDSFKIESFSTQQTKINSRHTESQRLKGCKLNATQGWYDCATHFNYRKYELLRVRHQPQRMLHFHYLQAGSAHTLLQRVSADLT